MTKKKDFLRSEQSRDKHPESDMVGSASSETARGLASQDVKADDQQVPHSGKSANDHNQVGDQHPTQKNEGRRTPQSRHERDSLVGRQNVVESRTGGKGGGRGPRGAG